MKYIKKFDKLFEFIVHNEDEEIEDKYFLLYKKDLFIFTEEEYVEKKLYDKFNKLLGIRFLDDSIDLLCSIYEERFDILSGKITNNKVYINVDVNFRQSEHSSELKKLYKQFGLPIVFNVLSTRDTNLEIDVNIKDTKLSDRIFYHGTSLYFLKGILKNGIMPTEHSNFSSRGGGIKHDDKIFFTLNLEKAEYHAFIAAENTNSFPIIIAFKVPDISKLIPDYDLTLQTYGKQSNISKKYGYNKFDTYDSHIGFDEKKDITNKIGVFGYLGRIPATFITDIWFDIQTYADNIGIFHPYLGERNIEINSIEFNDVTNWSEISPKDILRRIDDINSEFEGDLEEDDEYEEDEEDDD